MHVCMQFKSEEDEKICKVATLNHRYRASVMGLETPTIDVLSKLHNNYSNVVVWTIHDYTKYTWPIKNLYSYSFHVDTKQ